MFKNNLIIAIRNLSKHSAYSLINILGLAVGMTCCLLIMLFVQDELSYDQFHKNSDQVYRVTRDFLNDNQQSDFHIGSVSAPIGKHLREDFPNITVMRSIRHHMGVLLKRGDFSAYTDDFLWTDPTFFDLFTFQLIQGDPKTALTNPNTIVLTQSAAQKYFGNENPFGQTLMRGNTELTITGIMPDLPHNTHLKFDILGSFATIEQQWSPSNFTNWGNNSYPTYVMLPKNMSADHIQQQLPNFMQRHAPRDQATNSNLYLQKIIDIHLRSHLDDESGQRSDITYVYLFSAIAFFILLIACVNFMNLSTARSTNRAREVGMRKVVGAHRSQLIRQFLGESLFLATLALLLAVALVELTLPWFNSFVNKPLTFSFLKDPSLILTLITITLFVGLISGSYPALFLSRFLPIAVLKGKLSTNTKQTRLRKGLVIFQFTTSIALIICTIIIFQQLNHTQTKNLGLNKERIVIIPRFSQSLHQRYQTIRQELLQHPNIINMTVSRFIPSQQLLDGNTYRMKVGNETRKSDMRMKAVIPNFLETYNINLLAGRSFSHTIASDSLALVLNATGAKSFGLSPQEAINKTVRWWGKTWTVIGVTNDYHFESLHEPIKPLVMFLKPNWSFHAAIRLGQGDTAQTLAFIKEKWAHHRPNAPFEYHFLEDRFNSLYKSETDQAHLLSTFSLIAIFVACLGLFGLVSFAVSQRLKEIGIRKVLGASQQSLLLLLSKDFIQPVLFANLIAWPIAYFAMNQWLQNFAYRITQDITAFIIGGLLTFAIAFITISTQALKAARANPTDILRNE